jgi:hypothetical protein
MYRLLMLIISMEAIIQSSKQEKAIHAFAIEKVSQNNRLVF